jgi:hypothetical protein
MIFKASQIVVLVTALSFAAPVLSAPMNTNRMPDTPPASRPRPANEIAPSTRTTEASEDRRLARLREQRENFGDMRRVDTRPAAAATRRRLNDRVKADQDKKARDRAEAERARAAMNEGMQIKKNYNDEVERIRNSQAAADKVEANQAAATFSGKGKEKAKNPKP